MHSRTSSYPSYGVERSHGGSRMTFKRKLLICGLVGTTCLALYKLSKKKEKEKEKLRIEQAQHAYNVAPQQPQSGGGHNYAAWGAGAAAVGAAGAYVYHHHQQQSQSSPAAQAQPEATGDTLWADLKDWKVIARLLAATVADQYLYPFYDWPKIQHMAQHIANNGTLTEVAESWEMPPFLAQDLVKLALFDVMFLCDDSASMNSEKGARIEGLRQIIKRAADAAGRMDPDGMEFAWMNADLAPQDTKIRSAKDADRQVRQCRFDGRATPLGHSLEQKVLRPNLMEPLSRGYLKKPVLVIIITDGRPTGSTEKGEKIVRVIKDAKERLEASQYGEDALSVTIAAVGQDSEAQDWLDSIDSHPVIGDLVDVVSDIHQEGRQIKKTTGVDLTPDLHCLKLLLGGIDSGYDASDEPPSGKHDRRARAKEAKDRKFSEAKRRLVADRDAAMAGGATSTQYGYPQQGGGVYPPAQPSHAPPSGGSYGGTGAYPPSGSPAPYPPQSGYGAPPSAGGPTPYGVPPSNYGAYGSDNAPPPYAQASRDQFNGASAPVPSSPYGHLDAHSSGPPGGSSAGFHPGVGGFAMPQPQQHSGSAYGMPPPGGPSAAYGQGQAPQSTYPGQGQGPQSMYPGQGPAPQSTYPGQNPGGFPSAFPS
ncbi:unnamed protein product [Parajaminaea phylloscopi]